VSAGLKPDADQIRAFLADLPKELRLDPRRAVWARHAYHYTDVTNAAKVLLGGALLSRARCGREGVAFRDAANQEVISQSSKAHGYVRLYFRPRTPTQYRMEGIQPADKIVNGAHCPVPVFFLFDARELFVRRGVGFSDGSLARRSGYRTGGSAEFLQSIPFDAVYHDWSIPPEQRNEIVFRRHAEVLVRDRLELDCLREIVCRSGAERVTLLSLLGSGVGDWSDRIRVERPDEVLFFKRGLYVMGLTLIGRTLTIRINPWPGQFTYRMKLWDGQSGRLLRDEERPVVFSNKQWTVDVREPVELLGVELHIDDALAFRGAVTMRNFL